MSAEKTTPTFAERVKPWRLTLAVAVLYVVAATLAPARALEAAKAGGLTFIGVAPIIVAVFSAMGLVQVFVDKQKLARYLGERAGLGALLAAAAVGTILMGPVFVVFPLLKTMREHGTSWAVITTTLTAWAVKLPMVPLEAGFLGWKFSIARMALTLIAAVIMGLVVDRLMQGHDEVAEKDREAEAA